MIKEELKKEAIQYAVDYPTSYGKGYKHKDLRIAYLAGAEPREKRIDELEKAYNEAEELLDKQIEATYKVVEENKELKEKLKPENCLKLLAKEGYIKFSSDQLTYAKTIIQDLLDNTDEYARQRAEDFLKENK